MNLPSSSAMPLGTTKAVSLIPSGWRVGFRGSCLRFSILLLAASAFVGLSDTLERSFRNPPDVARPWVYWFWMDGNVSREGITTDLEAMRRAGIGGAILMEVDVGIARGPVRFMSASWQALFAHAVHEAERLGLEITLNAGPGWTGSGGPWVKAEQSMQHLVASVSQVTGPARFDTVLPRPLPREPHSVHAPIPATLKPARDAFYADVAVVAYPTGTEGPRIADGDEQALYYRNPYSSMPGVKPYLPATAHDAHFEAFIGTLLRAVGPRPNRGKAGWTMLHIDSWEMGAQNWTARFGDEFRRRRGYDPLPFLPAMTGRIVDTQEVTERFLWDIRQTAQELVVENHAEHLKELGARHGFGLSIEPYDMNPCADLSLGGVADVPMGEFWAEGYGFNTAFSCIEAVSVAHTRGRPIVAAESFTAVDTEAWRLHPGALKAQADWAFCTGINRLVVHRYAHQPAAWLQPDHGSRRKRRRDAESGRTCRGRPRAVRGWSHAGGNHRSAVAERTR